MSQTATRTITYSITDVQNVMRKFKSDLRMIAECTGAITTTEADNYWTDMELLAKESYLAYVDVTLLSSGWEVRAVRYDVNEDASDLLPNRPGGVFWPRMSNPDLRIVIGKTGKWRALTPLEDSVLRRRLRYTWVTTAIDLSHAGLRSNGNRNFISNGYGLTRQDYSA